MARNLGERVNEGLSLLQKTPVGWVKDKSGVPLLVKVRLSAVRWSRNHGGKRDESSSSTTYYKDGSIS